VTAAEAIASVDAGKPINPEDYDKLLRSSKEDYGSPERFKLSVYRKLNQLLWEKKPKKSRSSP
jgi:hypothetical protein